MHDPLPNEICTWFHRWFVCGQLMNHFTSCLEADHEYELPFPNLEAFYLTQRLQCLTWLPFAIAIDCQQVLSLYCGLWGDSRYHEIVHSSWQFYPLSGDDQSICAAIPNEIKLSNNKFSVLKWSSIETSGFY